MTIDGKAKVSRSVTVDNIVEANFKDLKGSTLWVRTRWENGATPYYAVGKDNISIRYLSSDDVETYISMLKEVRDKTEKVLEDNK